MRSKDAIIFLILYFYFDRNIKKMIDDYCFCVIFFKKTTLIFVNVTTFNSDVFSTQKL